MVARRAVERSLASVGPERSLLRSLGRDRAVCSPHHLLRLPPLTYYVSRYLPSFPYQDNPILHIYAGSICLYMSQDPDSRKDQKLPERLLDEAKAHFNRVITIDPGNCVAHIFLDQVHPVKIIRFQSPRLIPRIVLDCLDPKMRTCASRPRFEWGRSLQLDTRLLYRECAKTD